MTFPHRGSRSECEAGDIVQEAPRSGLLTGSPGQLISEFQNPDDILDSLGSQD